MQAFGSYDLDERGRLCYRPDLPPFPRLEELWPSLERAGEAIRAFDRALGAFAVPGVAGALFARLDAVHSSGAEGSTTTFTDLMEFQSQPQRVRDPEDAAGVAAVADVFDQLAESPAVPSVLARRIHARLFQHHRDPLLRQQAGHWKAIANSTYDPEAPNGLFTYAAPAVVPDLLALWDRFTLARDDGPELLRQGLSHWMFEHIHPVPDGNGRVGRLLVPLMLRQKGMIRHPCAFLGEAVHHNKDLYVTALKDARRRGEFGGWAGIFCMLVEQTAADNFARLERLQALYQGWQQDMQSVRRHSVNQRAILTRQRGETASKTDQLRRAIIRPFAGAAWSDQHGKFCQTTASA